MQAVQFNQNGIRFDVPDRPVVVVCLDGSADEYLDAAGSRGLMPNLIQMSKLGYRCMARGALPSFTNVNNSSIVTGVPPSIHGIGGNFFFDASTGNEVMMNSASYLRVGTILAAASNAGRKVGVVTAKEKLRDIFAAGLNGIAFSSEKAGKATLDTHGIENVEQLVGEPTPPIYSGAASIFVLKAGVALLKSGKADFLYLSTTDFIQHKYGPTDEAALDFYAGVDKALGELLALGAIIGITADHGMNAKQKLDGSPNVIYLESFLDAEFGRGFRVILPITDPYVVHHGALGSFAVVHLPQSGIIGVEAVQSWLMEQKGITEVHSKTHAARKLELPEDRIGDLVVLSAKDVVLGRTPAYHDLKAIEGGLRSHGGRYEEMVPFILSHPLRRTYRQRADADVRNFDIFDFTINGTDSAPSQDMIQH